jgi:CO/xanthine dehydrogenase FAD-binding subunit
MAGGLDSFDWLKDRIKKPKVVVDLSGIAELKGVRTTSDGIEIGAMTTLSEVVKHPVIREKYSLLAEGAELAASPQIRNQGTLAATYRRTHVAGTTVRVGRATGPAETSAMPTHQPGGIASTRFFTPSDAWQ